MPPSDLLTIVAIDLGAESCRVSLLHGEQGAPRIELVHRFANAPVRRGDALFWDLDRILDGLQVGLRQCAGRVAAIASIGVDGWAVDYVRLNQHNKAAGDPFCYRDARTESVYARFQRACTDIELFLRSGVQPLRFNTMFQLMADIAAGQPQLPWLNLPEYVLSRLGGRPVAEYTNATHTGLVDPATRGWNAAMFAQCGLDLSVAPELASTGSDLGQVRGELAALPALAETRLIATACHDTASAVAAIPLEGSDWAYISSGTWSLVGTVLDAPIHTGEAQATGFTNLGAAGSRICFHKNVNGMWLLRQTMEQLCNAHSEWPMPDLVAAAAALPPPQHLFDVDDPALLLPDAMATRINAQLAARGFPALPETSTALPQFASRIFHSLAARYAEVLRNVERLSGKKFRKLAIVGGGSLNQYLNQLTAQATGLEVICGAAESSTIGNFAIQLATLEGKPNDPVRIAHWARQLASVPVG